MKNTILNIAIIFCAVALGGLAGYLVYDFNETKVESEEVFVNLPIAAHDLESNAFITQADIEYLRIPESEVPDNAIMDMEELLDLIIVANHTTISQGSFFTYENTGLNFIADAADESLPLTSRLYLYPLEIANTIDYEIGDYIDIYLSGTVNSLEAAGAFLESVHIIDIDQNYLYLEVYEDMFQDLRVIEKIETVEVNITNTPYVLINEPVYVSEYLKALIESTEHFIPSY